MSGCVDPDFKREIGFLGALGFQLHAVALRARRKLSTDTPFDAILDQRRTKVDQKAEFEAAQLQV